MRAFLSAAVIAALIATPVVVSAQAQSTRSLAWDGSSRLVHSLGGDLTYVQGTDARVTVTGDAEFVSLVIVKNGVLTIDHERAKDYWTQNRRTGPVKVTVTAPSVDHIVFNSGGELAIRGYAQPSLHLTLNGSGKTMVAGTTEDLDLTLNGHGRADLSALNAGNARVVNNGRGDIDLAASETVNVRVAGGGVVRLLKTPRTLTKRVIGGGQVITAG